MLAVHSRKIPLKSQGFSATKIYVSSHLRSDWVNIYHLVGCHLEQAPCRVPMAKKTKWRECAYRFLDGQKWHKTCVLTVHWVGQVLWLSTGWAQNMWWALSPSLAAFLWPHVCHAPTLAHTSPAPSPWTCHVPPVVFQSHIQLLHLLPSPDVRSRLHQFWMWLLSVWRSCILKSNDNVIS